MHDIVTGAKSVEQARDYYAQEFLDYRRDKPTRYMDALRVPRARGTADPDQRVLSDSALAKATVEGSSR